MAKTIFNGGDPLEGCPTDWEQARTWTKEANGDAEDYEQPVWSFDCGFKLDYDGPIMNINSRFYPPKKHYGPNWDGSVTLHIMGREISSCKFECGTLDDLKIEVEKHTEKLRGKVLGLFHVPKKEEAKPNTKRTVIYGAG